MHILVGCALVVLGVTVLSWIMRRPGKTRRRPDHRWVRYCGKGPSRIDFYAYVYVNEDVMTVPGLPFKILQMPAVTVLLFEEFHLDAG
jgi:hypothetical protein